MVLEVIEISVEVILSASVAWTGLCRKRYIVRGYEIVGANESPPRRQNTPPQLENRKKSHLGNSGKAGLRRKIFRIDQPIERDAFSLISQAFFICNDDIARYFRESLSVNLLGSSIK